MGQASSGGWAHKCQPFMAPPTPPSWLGAFLLAAAFLWFDVIIPSKTAPQMQYDAANYQSYPKGN